MVAEVNGPRFTIASGNHRTEGPLLRDGVKFALDQDRTRSPGGLLLHGRIGTKHVGFLAMFGSSDATHP